MNIAITTLYPHQPSFTEILPSRQGRSRKTLRATVRHQGGIYVARWVGRSHTFFGKSPEEALKNLRGTE